MAETNSIELSVALETKDAVKALVDMTGAFHKSMEAFMKDVKKVSAAQKKAHTASLVATEDEIEALEKQGDKLNELKKEAEALARVNTVAAQARYRATQRQIKAQEELNRLEEEKIASRAGHGDADMGDRLAASVEVASKKFSEAMKNSGGKDLADAFSHAAKRDFVEMGKASGEAFKKMMTSGGDGIKGWGARMGGKADLTRLAAKASGSKMGHVKAAGQDALGGIAKALGPGMKMLAQLGPMLSMVGAGIAGIVKIFIDAHTQAKEFNATLLQGVGTAGFLADAGGSAKTAYAALGKTLDGVRNAAFDGLKNNQWGISSEEHQQFIGALTQEGYALNNLGKDAKKSGKSVEDFAGGLVHDAVTASRMLGVSVQEVGQFGAEMMADLGSNADDLQGAFANMARSAGASGMATSKFFAIVRGVSADLSLYDNRIGSAVKLLGKLGKVMSARSANKFMQTLSQGLGGMDQDSRLKLALLAGEKKTRAIMTADLDRQSKELAKASSKALGISLEDAQAKMGTARGRSQLAGDLSKAKKGALSESVMDLSINQSAMKKGAWGMAAAMKGASMGAAYDIQSAALKNFSGASSITEGIGTLGQDKIAQLLGISEDQVRGMAKVEMAMDNQKAVLLDQLKNGTAEQKQAAMKQLTEAGAQAGSAEEMAKQLENGTISTSQLWQTLSKDQQDSLEAATLSQQDMAQRQVAATDTVAKKIERMTEWLMNTLYNMLVKIQKLLGQIPGVDDGDKAAELAAGNETLQRAVESSDMKGTLAGGEFGTKVVGLSKSKEGQRILKDTINAQLSPEELQQMADRAGVKLEGGATIAGIANRIRTDAGDGRATTKRGGLNLDAIAKEAGITEDQMNQMLASLAWASDDRGTMAQMVLQVTKESSDASKLLEAEAAKAAAASAGPSADAEDYDGSDPVVAGPSIPEQPAAAAGAPASLANSGLATPADTAKAAEAMSATVTTSDNIADISLANEKMAKALGQKGIKMEKGFMTSDLYKVLKDSTYESFSKALFEYALYSRLSTGELTDMAKQPGFNAATAGATYVEGLQKNAAGGFVTGVRGGIAQVSPARGEGLASIGAGERIVPAGGGGNPTVSVTVNGIGGNDLAKLIEAKVADGIYEYKRREGYTN